jgi:hypothetical protein
MSPYRLSAKQIIRIVSHGSYAYETHWTNRTVICGAEAGLECKLCECQLSKPRVAVLLASADDPDVTYFHEFGSDLWKQIELTIDKSPHIDWQLKITKAGRGQAAQIVEAHRKPKDRPYYGQADLMNSVAHFHGLRIGNATTLSELFHQNAGIIGYRCSSMG